VKLRRFSGLSLRNLRARVQRTLLTAVGIVLGVGIVFGVLTLSDTMSGTFKDLFTRAYGSADLTVTAAGGSGGFDQKVVEAVRGYEGVGSAAPNYSLSSSLILDKVRKNRLPEVRTMRLFGVEPRSAKLATGFELTDGHFPHSGKELTLDGSSAKSAGLRIGDGVTVGTPDGPKKLKLVGLLRIPGGSFGGLAFGIVPLHFAQKAFDKQGQISSIAVEAAEGVSVSDLSDTLNRKLGEGLQAERSETRTQEVSGQLQGFKIALLFFAGTSLFVGAFLVFNALSMTILERTRELGMLRALGSTRAMIGRSVIVEAMLLGILGSLLGVLFGYGMAKGLVYLFGRAFLFEITTLILSPFALVSAIVVGIAVTVVAALYPAMKAGRVSPVEAMRARSAGATNESAPSRGGAPGPGLGPRAHRRRGALDLLPRQEPLCQPRGPRLRLGDHGNHRGLPWYLPGDPRPRKAARGVVLARTQAPVRGRGEDGRGERDAQQGEDGANGLGPHGRHLARRGVLGPRREPPRLDQGLPRRLPRK